jgi:hypothetical protein
LHIARAASRPTSDYLISAVCREGFFVPKRELRALILLRTARNGTPMLLNAPTYLWLFCHHRRAHALGSKKGNAKMNRTNSFMAAAVTGILAGAAACGGQASPAPAAPATEAAPVADATPTEPVNDRIPADNDSGQPSKHACKGLNDCKGRGGCKTELNSCRGKNECKGRGGCKSL